MGDTVLSVEAKQCLLFGNINVVLGAWLEDLIF